MGIYANAIRALRRGCSCQVEVTNSNLAPKIPQGTKLTLFPPNERTVFRVGDVLLYRDGDRERLLLVKSISVGRLKIGTATKALDGWAARSDVLGYANLAGTSDGDGSEVK